MNTVLFFVFLVLLSGCAGYHPRPLSPADTAASLERRTMDSAGLKEFLEKNIRKEIKPWPPRCWDFAMLNLAALYYHPDMDVARARWGVAEAEVVSAGGRPNPRISFMGQHHSMTAGGLSPWTSGLSFDIPIETAGKRGYRIRKAEHLSDAALLNITASAWQVRSRLRKSLQNLYSATVRKRLLNDRLAVQQEITRLFEERFAAGESSQFEVSRVRLAANKTRLLRSEAQRQKAEARAALAQALGLQVSAMKGVSVSFKLFEEVPVVVGLQETRRQALLSRPDVLAALSEYEASQSALQFEVARQYPDIHLGPGYEWDQGDNKWSLGFSIALPLFNRHEGPIEEAEARRKESAAKFAALQARIVGEIDRALAAYGEAIRKVQVADSLVSAENSRMQVMQARFALGEADRLDLEAMRLEFSSAELSRFDALVSAIADLGTLEDAIQQPLIEQEVPPGMPPSYLPSGEGIHNTGMKK